MDVARRGLPFNFHVFIYPCCSMLSTRRRPRAASLANSQFCTSRDLRMRCASVTTAAQRSDFNFVLKCNFLLANTAFTVQSILYVAKFQFLPYLLLLLACVTGNRTSPVCRPGYIYYYDYKSSHIVYVVWPACIQNPAASSSRASRSVRSTYC